MKSIKAWFKKEVIVAVVLIIIVGSAFFGGDAKANHDAQPTQSESESMISGGFAIDIYTPDGTEYTLSCQPFDGNPGYYVCKIYRK